MSEAAGVGEQRILAGRYALGEFIGQGGMATVYRGTDTKLGRQVAIKVMKAELAHDDQFRSRFRQEAQSAARMAHPTIVRVFDAGDDLIQTADGAKRLPFIVMEYVEGTNLRQLVQDQPLSLQEAARVTESVLTALEYSHRAGIVHRDIKPANVMITKTGQVKVMDFGISRAVSDTSSTLQQTTAILGTAAYFSPEQAKGEPIDPRTDLYSTAVLLYELLTGNVPFVGESAVSVAYQHVSERPKAPSTRNPEVTAELDAVVLHGLVKDRTRRFQTAAEFRTALREASIGQMPDLPQPDTDSSMLFTSGDEVSDSDLALRQLAESGGSRSQSRPPVMWTWAAILTVAAIVVAVIFWLVTLPSPNIETAPRVPDLTNYTRAEAIDALGKQNLIPLISEENSESIPGGYVISTDPEAGTTLSQGAEVGVVISLGPESAAVPEVGNATLDAYTKKLQELGLRVGEINQSDDPLPANRVLEVVPEPKTELRSGSTVDITVSSGLVEIPDLTGQSLEVARSLTSSLNVKLQLRPLSTADTGCEVGESLPIMEQSLIGRQPQGSALELTYCTG
ncbi:Stk1 family PASTA domain-containing Ser/Thr kinase [Leucobacter sp. cx-42]|uniref:Stk1 family PASTA domain-containing Ser/Thr kinase n=1 Tax=unclassified Leucobacter TaxID=2621730 RepID=UPI00165D5B31|nr:MULTISPECIES: Stk1 family PASTA domain-containing Ser/Thr kinase [unclassified Leucobacter]MBC9955298.1 Stk1 family PASTA domain-containing Ser/Thr kinase [Leucobacter sp. cx-42]